VSTALITAYLTTTVTTIAATATTSATTTVSSSKSGACYAAGFLALVSAYKWYGYVESGKTKDAECGSIQDYSNTGGGGGQVNPTSTPTTSSGSKSVTLGASGSGSGTGTEEDSSKSLGVTPTQATTKAGLTTALKSPAMAKGPLGAKQNQNTLYDNLKKTGVSLSQIKNGLANSSPASVIAGLGKFPASVTDEFKRMEKDPNNPFNKAGVLSGATAKSSAKTDAEAPKIGFVSDEPKPTPKPDLSFGKKKGPEDLGTDIFHANYKGSIFQIVTRRLDLSREKVDKLEWASPMNRMLLGLPGDPNAKPQPVTKPKEGISNEPKK